MLGRVLGNRYRVMSRIGEGGMGTVYLCEHTVLKRRFALKVLRADLGDDAELVERFRNEAIAASRIAQENVVDVVDFGAEEDGALYYVMEALDGKSLGAILREEGSLSVRRALALLEQVCRALGAAHERGVVHRDVKPENVFVVRRDDGSELAKVLDFGISHVPTGSAERLTRAGSIIGTPEYMAPEQATGGVVDHRADVYAVGVLAYEILTGVLPIEAASDIATLVAAQTQPPEPPSLRNAAVPPEVDALVLKALAKRPEDRHGSMHALASEIARLRSALVTASGLRAPIPASRYELGAVPGPLRARGETVSLPERSATRPGRTSRTRAALVGAAALAALGAAAFGGWWVRGAPAAAGVPEVTAKVTAPEAARVAASRPEDPPSAGVTSAAAATLAPAATPVAVAALSAPAAVAAPPARLAPPGAAPASARQRRTAEPPEGARDPYRSTGDLKPDPFE